MKATGSISRGKVAEKHNTRECYPDRERTPQNIDTERTGDNIVLANRPIEDVYRERFGAATEAYNARQRERKHPERQIRDYLEHVRQDKKLQPMYEFVVQVGNMDEHPDAETAAAVYREWLDGFRDRFGEQFAVKQAIIHLDEKTPHMHVEVVPCATSGRGLSVQNSMNKAVKQAGFEGYKQMLAGWDEILTEVMERHGIERVAGDREKQMGGVDIHTFKASKELERQNEEAAARLESVRQRTIELESAKEPIAESARTLISARGDGKREEGLGSEIEGLRSRISALEGECAELGGRERDLTAGMPELRRRHQQLGERFRAIEIRVTKVMSRLHEVPETLSRWALDIAKRIGIKTYDPMSLDYMMREAVRVSHGMESQQQRGRSQDRGFGR